ncbi:cupin domain-containing protein [Pontimicrobium sp. SW4]|uniref:Cupin domain-containing protein n=1 Tax=Pontimicrobium sp. SW4 TaxID=3153519 RepID=A0AAU7BT81_9FLAO
MKKSLNLNEAFGEIKDYFLPKIVGEVNDVYAKLSKIKGNKVPWHAHENEDELFYIIRGELLFEIENKPSFIMKEGDLFIVPKGITHRVSSAEECHILLIESKETLHTGNVQSEITKSISEQQY